MTFICHLRKYFWEGYLHRMIKALTSWFMPIRKNISFTVDELANFPNKKGEFFFYENQHSFDKRPCIFSWRWISTTIVIYIFGRLAIASVAMINLQLFSKIRRGNVHLSLVSFWPIKLTQLSEYCWIAGIYASTWGWGSWLFPWICYLRPWKVFVPVDCIQHYFTTKICFKFSGNF